MSIILCLSYFWTAFDKIFAQFYPYINLDFKRKLESFSFLIKVVRYNTHCIIFCRSSWQILLSGNSLCIPGTIKFKAFCHIWLKKCG